MSSSSLEPFILLAKSAKGAAAVELIKQVLDAPGVYVFGELLDMPNVMEVRSFCSVLMNRYKITAKFFNSSTLQNTKHILTC